MCVPAKAVRLQLSYTRLLEMAAKGKREAQIELVERALACFSADGASDSII